ncbi:MAG: hypothetical protein IKH28_14865 [Lachnospiraceae bacterium]|nr:hypothetical protein [Lachnospiraceae bacterium]
MDKNEVFSELDMSYDDLVMHLLNKYGRAEYDYFCTPECKTRNTKVSRTKEGLYCHHIDEDKEECLSESIAARRCPFECQKKERLVYCNLLEHIILHIKILVKKHKIVFSTPMNMLSFFEFNGLGLLLKKTNDMYMCPERIKNSEKKCFEVIRDNYSEYIIILDAFIEYAKNKYAGEKKQSRFLNIGASLRYNDDEYRITRMSDDREFITIKTQNNNEITRKSRRFRKEFQYLDVVDLAVRQMSYGYHAFFSEIYDDLVNCNY